MLKRIINANWMVSVVTMLTSLSGLAISVGIPLLISANEYSVFATVWAFSQLLATLAFEWMRFCVLRFSAGSDILEAEKSRSLLTSLYLITFSILIAVAVGMAVASFFDSSIGTVFSVTLLFAAMNGVFDGYQSLLRAEGKNAEYSLGRISRTFLGFIFAIIAAVIFGTPEAIMVGLALSYPVSIAITYRPSLSPSIFSKVSLKDRELIRSFFVLGFFASVTTNLAMLLPALQRLVAVKLFGLSEAAGLVLSFDLSQKAIAVVGLAINVIVMQTSIRVAQIKSDPRIQSEQAGRQMSQTMVLIAPAAVGFYLIGEPLAEMVISPEMRNNFLIALLPAVMAGGLLAFRIFSIDPLFVVRKTTVSGTVGAAVTAILMTSLLFLPSKNMDVLNWQIVFSIAVGVVISIVMLRRSGEIMWPWKDFLGIILGSLFMIFAGKNYFSSSAVSELIQVFIISTLAYAIVVISMDTAGIRSMLRKRARK